MRGGPFCEPSERRDELHELLGRFILFSCWTNRCSGALLGGDLRGVDRVDRLHRLDGPQTATRLRELEAAWEAWDAATAVVIDAEAAAAAVVAAMPPRPTARVAS